MHSWTIRSGPLSLPVRPAELAGLALYGSIAAAVLRDAPLHGLVNNAGIAVAGPVELAPLERWRTQLEVNVIGLVSVSQAFLPALRPGRGRIVNIGSIAGRMALPCSGPYCASKYAMEAITDSLRMELAPFGIAVAVIEPGVRAVERALTAARPRTRYPVERDAKLRLLLSG